MGIQEQIAGEKPDIVDMVPDGLLTQPCLLQRVLKTIQDRLVRQLNRVHPLLIHLGMLSFRHGIALFTIALLLPLVSPSRQDRLAILEKNNESKKRAVLLAHQVYLLTFLFASG